MLTLKNIHVTFGRGSALERKILDHLYLHVNAGEWVVVIGGNGAGKSTLFNVISGSVKADSGHLWIDDCDVTHTSQSRRTALVSQVMQDPKVGTIASMTVFENMAFAFKRGQRRGLQLACTKDRTILFQKKLSMANMGLEDRLHAQVSTLSGGQRQVLSIVMAVLQRSNILLLDEITAALDPKSSTAMMEFTDHIVREHRLTCIMITHNMTHAITYGDRLVLLKDGKFIQEYAASAKSQLTPTRLAAEFGEI